MNKAERDDPILFEEGERRREKLRKEKKQKKREQTEIIFAALKSTLKVGLVVNEEELKQIYVENDETEELELSNVERMFVLWMRNQEAEAELDQLRNRLFR